MNALKLLSYFLCRLDGKGRAVRVHERKTFKGICRLADKNPSLFVVQEFVAIDEKADDLGTVYFFDLNGGQVEATW